MVSRILQFFSNKGQATPENPGVSPPPAQPPSPPSAPSAPPAREVPAAAAHAAPHATTAAPAEPPLPPEAKPHREQLGRSGAFVLREPVLNFKRQIVGYQLSCALPDEKANQAHPTQVDETLCRYLGELAQRERPDGGKGLGPLGRQLAFVHVCPQTLDQPHLPTWLTDLPRDQLVVLLDLSQWTGNEDDGRRLAASLAELRKMGFILGLTMPHDKAPLSDLARHIKLFAVDVAERDGDRLKSLAIALRSGGTNPAELLATNLHTADEIDACQRLGYSYFQGPAVSIQDAWCSPKGSASRMHIVRLLNVTRNEGDNRTIAELLRQDPVLSYRILRYINSAAIGLRVKVTNIEHALVILGHNHFYRWLSLLLFSSTNSGHGDWLVIEHSLTRGRLMELLGKGRFPDSDRDQLFLSGAFSLLDRLLQMPLNQAMDQLSLADNIRQVILERSGPYAPLLQIATACESFDPAHIAKAAEAGGFSPDKVNRALLEAMTWAHDVTELSG